MVVVVDEGIRLRDALADLGIRPKSIPEGKDIRLRCPKCDGGNDREDCLSLKIDIGGLGAVWHCYRGNCGWIDSLIVGRSRSQAPERPALAYSAVRPIAETEQSKPKELYDFFGERGISEATVDAFGVYLTTHWFPAQGRQPAGLQAAITFPYIFNGEVVNRKYRSFHKVIMQEKSPLPTLFNVDCLVDAEYLVFCEGEPDCMAIHEAGWKNVVTLKDGAPAKLLAPDDPKRDANKRFAALETHADKLQRVAKFYLAGDADEPGLVLREEMARRLGRNKCWLVTWPDGCKDACDALRKHGPDVVNSCLQEAAPYPIADVQKITGERLDAHLELPPPKVMTTGTTALDRILALPGEGRLIVVTGTPSAGKSTLMIFLMSHLALRERRRWLVFSPEMQPWEEFATQVAEVVVGKSARRKKGWVEGDALMSRQERRNVGDWLTDKVMFLASDSEDQAPTLEWILERANDCVLRMGITDLLIDPWNEIEHSRDGATETDYTGRSLQKLKGFANRRGCNVWIVVHPTKMRADLETGNTPPPGGYDISGSANWANKTDLGLTLHNPDNLITSVIIWKSRFARWGTKKAAAELEFDHLTGRYESPMRVQSDFGPDPWSDQRSRGSAEGFDF